MNIKSKKQWSLLALPMVLAGGLVNGANFEKYTAPRGVVLHEQNGVRVYNGGFGSGMAAHPTQAGVYYLMTDRGSNFDGVSPEVKVFPKPEFAPMVGVFRAEGGQLVMLDSFPLRDENGIPLTGLPNPAGEGGTGEKALDLAGNQLPPDPNGLDPEGLGVAPDGSFWVSDEYGPHIVRFDANGKTIERINPFGTGVGGRKIPAVFATRRANRGMEGLDLTPDGKTVVGIMQSQLDNPASARAAIRTNSRVVRILTFDIESGRTSQHVYLLERPSHTVSEIRALGNSEFIVLERDGNFPDGKGGGAFKRFFKISLAGATDISDPADGANGRKYNIGGVEKTVEQLALIELLDLGIVPAAKSLHLDLLKEIPNYPHDKPEGFAVLADGRLAIMNDDDFATDTDGMGGIKQKTLPATGEADSGNLYVVGASPAVKTGFTLQLLHSSDNESSFVDPNTLEPKILNYGAVKRGLDLLAEREGMASIYVTAGDHTLPGPFYLASAEAPAIGVNGGADIAFYNAMGLVANGMGNHEFDGGIKDFAKMLARANYPFIAANLDFSKVSTGEGTPPIQIGVDGGSVVDNAGKVARSSYVEVKGEKIGLIGRAPASFFQVIQNPSTTLPGLDFVGGRDAAGNPLLPALPMILEQVDLLKAKGINKIILLDHAQDFTSDPLSTSAMRDIDIIVSAGSTGFLAQGTRQGPFNFLRPGDSPTGGYPATRIDSQNNPVLVVNSEQLYKYLGNLIVRFNDHGVIDHIDPRSGPIATTKAAITALSEHLLSPTLRPNEATQATFDALAATPRVNSLLTLVGTTTATLNGLRADVRTRETNLGRLAADSTLWYAKRHLESLSMPANVDIALKNGGGIRDTILGPSITMFTIGAALSFNNTLAIVELNAAELIATFENAVSRHPAADGRFPQVAGVFVEFDPSMAGQEAKSSLTTPSRVKTLVVTRHDGSVDVVVENYMAVGDLGRTFKLATNSFQATGGDGYEALRIASGRGSTPTVVGEQQVLADYIREVLSGTVALPEPLTGLRVRRTGATLNFALWSELYFTPGLVGTRAGDDFDNDGISNGEEYAHGLNPILPDHLGVLVMTTIEQGVLVLRHTRLAASRVKWVYEAASDLATGPWAPLAPGADYTAEVVPAAGGAELVTLRIRPTADEIRFVRVSARAE